jgi:hypothetical protein
MRSATALTRDRVNNGQCHVERSTVRLIAKNGVELVFRLVPGAGKHMLDWLFAV